MRCTQVGAALAPLISLLASPVVASPAEQLRTAGSVEIREAVGLSVLGNSPLQLLLTSGGQSVRAFTLAPASNGAPATETLLLANSITEMQGSGSAPAMTANGEVMSVSMTGEETVLFASATASGSPVHAIIAQFN